MFMVNGPAATILGTVAASFTTLAFVPQIRKISKTGGKDVSFPMLTLYLIGVSLWLGYGLALGAAALSWANAASIVFVGACISLKLVKEREPKRAPGSERRRLRIAIDMDETIADSLKEHIRRFNAAFGANLTGEELQGKNIEDLVPSDQRPTVRRMVQDESFFGDLDVIEDAQQVVRDLSGEHEVFIVSAAMDVPESFAAKYRWLRRHFSFIPVSNLVFCGDKEIINADYLIDDQARHFRGFQGTGILFSAPHNAKESGRSRVENWQQVRRLFLEQPGDAEYVRSDRAERIVAREGE
jgi:5'-nucleotidase